MEEIWVDVIDHEGRYKVSNLGRVSSFRFEGHILKPLRLRDNYLAIVLQHANGTKKHRMIHRLVAQHFIPNPDNKPQVNHKDGNIHNNHADNLEWVTPKENIHHSIRLGLQKTNGNRVLDDVQAGIIRDAIHAGFSGGAIAKYFGVSSTVIYGIRHNKTYKGYRKMNQ